MEFKYSPVDDFLLFCVQYYQSDNDNFTAINYYKIF
jgi:hypothetical protein